VRVTKLNTYLGVWFSGPVSAKTHCNAVFSIVPVCRTCMSNRFDIQVRHTGSQALNHIRFLMHMYSNNCVRIAWGGAISDYSSAVNTVKEGSVLSTVLYCEYIDDLLLVLSDSGVSCYIGVLRGRHCSNCTHTATAMRKLFSSGEYAIEYCISFNASKSKCIARELSWTEKLSQWVSFHRPSNISDTITAQLN